MHVGTTTRALASFLGIEKSTPSTHCMRMREKSQKKCFFRILAYTRPLYFVCVRPYEDSKLTDTAFVPRR